MADGAAKYLAQQQQQQRKEEIRACGLIPKHHTGGVAPMRLPTAVRAPMSMWVRLCALGLVLYSSTLPMSDRGTPVRPTVTEAPRSGCH